MSNTEYDVAGIGNAIVDIIARCDEAFLSNHGMEKGFMQLIDALREHMKKTGTDKVDRTYIMEVIDRIF